MLREASVTMPRNTEDQREVVRMLAREMMRQYGGVSEYDGRGSWQDETTGIIYHDTNTRLVSAVDPDTFLSAAFRQMVIAYAEKAEQLAVYVTLPDGTAEILDTAYVPAESHVVA